MSASYSPGRNAILDRVFVLPAHADLRLPKTAIPHPLDLGFEFSIGEPHGQVADFRAELPDGRGLHIRDMAHTWLVHWDRVFPRMERIVDHLREDSPFYYLLLLAGIAIVAVLAMYLLLRWLVRQPYA